MRIVCLCENTAVNDKLFAEHGLCLYIEHCGKKILFGTSSTAVVFQNATRLNIPIESADAIVLPHNHTSMTGAVETFLKKNPSATLYMKKSCATDNGEKHGILRSRTGIPHSFFKANKMKCVLYTAFSEVCPDFYLASVKHYSDNPCTDKRYTVKRHRKWVKDDFSGEAFAVCFPGRRKDGFVILTGCSHSGIVNIVKTAQEMWDAPVLAVVGGFGMMSSNINKLGCTADAVKSTAKALAELDIGYIYTCHCTGRKGYEIMKEVLGDQIQYLHTGEELEF